MNKISFFKLILIFLNTFASAVDSITTSSGIRPCSNSQLSAFDFIDLLRLIRMQKSETYHFYVHFYSDVLCVFNDENVVKVLGIFFKLIPLSLGFVLSYFLKGVNMSLSPSR